MLSVRGRDGGKGLELGLGYESDAAMDEPELEEGEACFYQDFDDDDNDFDTNVDLDVALSYIDEKLQDVLGHCQKDFEGGLTLQNLGAKFGDYGSFLPTYQRDPAGSHLRSPAKVDNNLTTSLSKSRPEGAAHMSRRHEEASASNVAKKTKANVSSSRFELEKNYDNLSTQRLAKSYNESTLDLSSSSLGESRGSEGGASDESPTRILQIMTSLPVYENLLLSPLNAYLINLIVKQKKLQSEGKSTISQTFAKASMNRSDPSKSDSLNFRDNKSKSSQKGIYSLPLKNLNDDTKIHTDALACEKPATSASKDIPNVEKSNINDQFQEKKAENADFIDEKATFNNKKDVQLPLEKNNSSSGRKKKLKGTHNHNEGDKSVVPKRGTKNPKEKGNITKAITMYKDLFGEMELDAELDSEKNCLVELGEYDMTTDKMKLAPNSTTKKKLHVKKNSKSMSEADLNLAQETNIHVSQDDQRQFDNSLKKKVQAATNNRNLNGTNQSPLAKEVENVVEKHVHAEIVNDKLIEHCTNGGDNLSSQNYSKRVHDQNGSRVSKKIRSDGSQDQNLSVHSHKIKTEPVVAKKESTGGSKESTNSDHLAKSEEINCLGVESKQKQNLDIKSLEKDLDKGRSHSLPPSGRDRSETVNNFHHINHGEHKENGVNHSSMNTSGALKPKKSANNGHKVGDKDALSLGKRDSSSNAVSNALREATDLKHIADRLKSTGASAESTGFYFEAALKFLHGAFLLETGAGESAKQNEVIQSMQIYSSTGQLCGYCAQQYEKSKDMVTAALAYKCMEIAYMRVIYSSRVKANRDHHELEAASQIGPPGESPLSSASDVDNLNNPKSDKAKAIISSPQVAATCNHVISSGNRPSFVRLLSYARDVNSAMEASRKCKIAFAAANQRMVETKSRGEDMASVKRALDFNFQDVEGLLRLVRLAMEAISH